MRTSILKFYPTAPWCKIKFFIQAIAKLGWLEPTLIQEKTIPLLLEGKDVLIRARTGSGKTAAFAIPMIQKILLGKQSQQQQQTKGLILTPSKELCKQIHEVIRNLTLKCCREVKCVDVSPQVELSTQKPLLAEKPDIIIGTPGRVLQHLKAGNMKLKHSMETLVIDEADLVNKYFLSYFIYLCISNSWTLSLGKKKLQNFQFKILKSMQIGIRISE